MIYIIKQIKSSISVAEYQDELLQPLKKDGEELWEYDKNFWEWFKEKIAYNNEKLSFVVITDKDSFEIDSSLHLSSINQVAKKQDLIDEILLLKGSNKILFYPKLTKDIKQQKTQQPRKEHIQKIKRGGLVDFFTEQTKNYKKQ